MTEKKLQNTAMFTHIKQPFNLTWKVGCHFLLLMSNEGHVETAKSTTGLTEDQSTIQ